MAYCLLGIFDVQLPLLYGVGARNAFIGLQEQIVAKETIDLSLFAGKETRSFNAEEAGISVESAAWFAECQNLRSPKGSDKLRLCWLETSLETHNPAYRTIPEESQALG
jgi:hypothetical protein